MLSDQINSINDIDPVELRPGIFRRTLVYNDETMVCHFHLVAGSKLELHSHEASQFGYVIKGKVEFFREDGSSFIVTDGSAYMFQSWEKHGSFVHADTDFIECFSPTRPEYVDNA